MGQLPLALYCLKQHVARNKQLVARNMLLVAAQHVALV